MKGLLQTRQGVLGGSTLEDYTPIPSSRSLALSRSESHSSIPSNTSAPRLKNWSVVDRTQKTIDQVGDMMEEWSLSRSRLESEMERRQEAARMQSAYHQPLDKSRQYLHARDLQTNKDIHDVVSEISSIEPT